MLNALAASPHDASPAAAAPVPLERVMNDVLAVESAFVAKFLPYRTMTQLPPGFREFAQWHFQRLDDPGIRWQDAAPAYALACLSHAAYGSALDPSVEWELELQWADLRRLSRLEWPDARRLIVAAWSFLTSGDQLPADMDAAIDALNRAAESADPLDLDPYGDDDPHAWLASGLTQCYVVLRESMAERSPAAWRTRGQERWVSPEANAICLSLSPALAVLECVTSQGYQDEEQRYLVRVAFPTALLAADAVAPEGFGRPLRSDVRRDDARRHGDLWVMERRSAMLRVPSPICPGEFNVLAHQQHPDFSLLQLVDAVPLNLDRRQRH